MAEQKTPITPAQPVTKTDAAKPATEKPKTVAREITAAELIKTLFVPNNRLLTDTGEKLALNHETKNILAYFSDGTLVISNTHKYDGQVLSFVSLLNKTKNKITSTVYTSLGNLNEIYKENLKKKNLIPNLDAFNNQIQKDYVDIVSKAAERGVSDIHVIVGNETTILFRMDGTMQKMMEFDGTWGEAFVRSVFASADISDSNYAQNEFQAAQKLGDTPLRGSKDLYLPRNVLAIRLQFNPIAFGSQYLVMRLLYASQDAGRGLETLGLEPHQLELFYKMRSFPTGLCIIAGPTGSGKSTTLQQNMILMLKERNYEINLITVEDPPEYPIPGSRQMPVTNTATEEEKDAAFTSALAAALRSDPDAMMVGEIRTKSAADLTFRGALSGHNVWTTLHANSAIAILTRLLDMGVEDFKLGDASLMKGLVSQRLFKRLCPNCKKSLRGATDNPAYRRALKTIGQQKADMAYTKGPGCDVCKGKGVTGRIGVFEIILPDAKLLGLALERKTDEAIEYWKKELGGVSLREYAIEKMLKGLVSIDDVERWCGFLDEKELF